MSKRPGRPAEMPWLSPYLTVKDPAAALDFYQRAFGFEKRNVMHGTDGRISHAEVAWHEAFIMFGPEGAYGSTTKAPASSGVASPVALYVYCDDVDALYNRATAAGAKTLFPPQDMFWGDRLCKLTDPDGHVWNFATNVADFDPSKAPK
jgi:PhnB protein